MKQYIHRFDDVIGRSIARLPGGAMAVMRLASVIGHPIITVSIMSALCAFALIVPDSQLFMLGLIALLAFFVSSLLKMMFRRRRPDNNYVPTMFLRTFSFPSGHAAGSLVSFGLVGYLAWLYAPSAAWAIGLAVFAVCLWVGSSRVYLRAHYASDVIGGWLVGGAGLLAIVMAGL